MVSGPVDPVYIRQTAQREGYRQDDFERAYRLAHLLGEISRHPRLPERLALKGGTCINFFHTALPRLSVDMDLNYVGSTDKDTMQAQRPKVEEEIQALAGAFGYEPDVESRSYAGWKLRLLYENCHEERDSIRVDVNYVMRVPLYGFEHCDFPGLFELPEAEVPCLSLEDVYGGKLKALATRAEARDLYDAYRLFTSLQGYDERALRKALLFYAYMDDATLETVDLARIERIDADDLEAHLYPMLQQGDTPSAEELRDPVVGKLDEMLELDEAEAAFGKRLEQGGYEPGLLFGEVEASSEIDEHPSALWRAEHPHARLEHETGE